MSVKAIPARMPSQEAAIRQTCSALAEFLVAKNRRYGDAVGVCGEPVTVFAPEAKRDPSLTLRTRLDEKLNRLRAAEADDDEDVVLDLAGLLILLLAQRRFGHEVG